MKKTLNIFLAIILLVLQHAHSFAQAAKPKLVVLMVVDQMRWDYLQRYKAKYSKGGFNRLVSQGYNCNFTHIDYIPTYTAPGHASIATGAGPSVHGIVGNDWFDKTTLKSVYATEDSTNSTVGSTSRAGQMSPMNLKVTTFADELKLTNNKSKVIGIALKDRGGILLGGRTANAAYWFDDKSGNWITSTFYMAHLPGWVNTFNNEQGAQKYLKQDWNTLLPINQYTESEPDNSPQYEGKFRGADTPTLPENLSKLSPGNLGMIRSTPYGNSFTFDFAKAAIDSEKMGLSDVTDLLAVSFSSTDYLGHQFGIRSVEIEDTYLRFDRDLSDFLDFLDKKFNNDYQIVLTADHGAADNVSYAQDHKLPSGLFSLENTINNLELSFKKRFGDKNWIKLYVNNTLYLNDTSFRRSAFTKKMCKDTIIKTILAIPGVYRVVDMDNIDIDAGDPALSLAIKKGIYQKLAGDLLVILESGWYEGRPYKDGGITGTTHGTIYSYDTHIPLIWYGKNIKGASDYSQVVLEDIAPTICAILGIQEPSGNTGKVITGLLNNINSKK